MVPNPELREEGAREVRELAPGAKGRLETPEVRAGGCLGLDLVGDG